MTPSLPSLLESAAREHADRVALVAQDAELTFAQLADTSLRAAALLAAQGVGAGDRVAVQLPNCSQWPVVWLALARLGAVVVPVHQQAQEADLRHQLEDAGARLLIRPSGASTGTVAVPVLELGVIPEGTVALPDRTADDVMSLQYTSGSTGLPKGCVLTQGYWVRLGQQAAAHDPGMGHDDVLLSAQPFSYIDPQWHLVVALLTGCRLVLLDGFHPSTFLASVRAHGATVTYVLGAMPLLLLAQPPSDEDRRHALRHVLCSGIPAERHAELEERYGIPWYELYGSTEIGGAALAVTCEGHDEAVGTGALGSVSPGFEVDVTDDGELLIRSPNPMRGYWQGDGTWTDPRVDGWFASGDLVRDIGDGRLAFAGRTGDRLRRAGENISATEVESVLEQLPGVRLAAVVGEADALRGQEVHAVLETTGDVDVQTLVELASAQLARFKVPRFWTLSPLPRTPSGKVAKADLPQQLRGSRRYDRTTGEWEQR